MQFTVRDIFLAVIIATVVRCFTLMSYTPSMKKVTYFCSSLQRVWVRNVFLQGVAIISRRLLYKTVSHTQKPWTICVLHIDASDMRSIVCRGRSSRNERPKAASRVTRPPLVYENRQISIEITIVGGSSDHTTRTTNFNRPS